MYNMNGEQVADVELDQSIFAVDINEAVMHQALKRQLANARQGTASTKTRGQVAGGSYKPWRQKGTGRARQGTTRSPLWKGGGIVFGPHPRSYTQDMPRKARRLALKSALAAKVEENHLVLVDELTMEAPRTKGIVQTLQSIGVGPSALLVLHERNDNVERSARNLPGVKTLLATNLNLVDLLTHDFLVVTRPALDLISVTYGDKEGNDASV